MATPKNAKADFFDDESFDPVEVATGPGACEKTPEASAPRRSPNRKGAQARRDQGLKKKKAGFYVSLDLLDRFTRKFYELKLAGVAIENKSALLELALSFALDDLDRGTRSRLLQDMESRFGDIERLS